MEQGKIKKKINILFTNAHNLDDGRGTLHRPESGLINGQNLKKKKTSSIGRSPKMKEIKLYMFINLLLIVTKFCASDSSFRVKP